MVSGEEAPSPRGSRQDSWPGWVAGGWPHPRSGFLSALSLCPETSYRVCPDRRTHRQMDKKETQNSKTAGLSPSPAARGSPVQRGSSPRGPSRPDAATPEAGCCCPAAIPERPSGRVLWLASGHAVQVEQTVREQGRCGEDMEAGLRGSLPPHPGGSRADAGTQAACPWHVRPRSSWQRSSAAAACDTRRDRARPAPGTALSPRHRHCCGTTGTLPPRQSAPMLLAATSREPGDYRPLTLQRSAPSWRDFRN